MYPKPDLNMNPLCMLITIPKHTPVLSNPVPIVPLGLLL
jgi:hypothetical protein